MATYTEYTLKSGVKWAVRGYLGTDEVTGKQLEFNKRGFRTKKEAQAAYTRAKNDFYNGELERKSPKKLTYKQVYHEWLEQYKNTVRSSTLGKTKTMFRLHILPAFGDMYIDKVTSKVLQKKVNEWHKEFVQYRKVYNYACLVFKYAIVQGYIKDNPKDRIIIPTNKVEYKHKKLTADFYTRSELEEFMNIVTSIGNKKWIALFRILAFTGLRRGEALALTWKDIDFKNKTLKVTKTLAVDDNNNQVLNPPKTGKNRTISVDDTTLTILKEWKHKQAKLLIGFGFNALSGDQLLFNKWKNNKHLDLTAPYNELKRICDSRDFKMINIHGFRHTHCSLLFEAGVSMKDVMERLGHADIKTTMNVYAHVTEESANKSAELFAKYVNF